MTTQAAFDFNVVGSVAAWQHILNGCGYTPVLKITGCMDDATVKTTQTFQKNLGLPVTGEVTLETWQVGLKHDKLPDWQESSIPPIVRDNLVPQCGIDLIKRFEGYHEKLNDGTDRVQAGPDPAWGWQIPTIGYGTTRYPDGKKVKRGDIITRQQAEEYLRWEVEKKCKVALERIPTWKQMNDHQRGALYSFAYNLGTGFYQGRHFQSITSICDSPERWNDDQWIKAQFVKYNKSNGRVLAGLTRRREAEAELFCAPIS